MASAPIFDDLWTEAEAARQLRMGERTLRELRRLGKIRYVALTVRKIAYRPEDCAEYLAGQVRVNEPCETRPKVKRSGPRSGKIIPFSQQVG